MTVRYGMVGGGPGAFIGAVHRMAAALDGKLTLVAGAFASTPERSRRTGEELGLDPARVYGSFEEMAEAEARLPPAERIRLVSITTPNHLHHPVAKAFLERGVHVVCDKPLTTTLEDAEELCRLAAEHHRVFCVTHNYTGYPMVKEARERVHAGDLGTVRKIVVEYSQGWLSTRLEAEGQKQAEWRADPDRAGPSSALADIGSHAHDLAAYVTGLHVRELFADLGSVVEGREMEDDAAILLRYGTAGEGTRGLLFVSQISSGERNRLVLRVYGSEGGLRWSQESPGKLELLAPSGAVTTLYRGMDDLSERARAATRLPPGHPEGFIEAFANLYRNVAACVEGADGAAPGTGPSRESAGSAGAAAGPTPYIDDFPTVQDGARGVRFIHAALESHREGRWVSAAYEPPTTPRSDRSP